MCKKTTAVILKGQLMLTKNSKVSATSKGNNIHYLKLENFMCEKPKKSMRVWQSDKRRHESNTLEKWYKGIEQCLDFIKNKGTLGALPNESEYAKR